ncbi:MAG: Trm112 family protein [Crenarchaeota archaeon]|nr:Trm112 family protein [Thermoproteota archaeon]
MKYRLMDILACPYDKKFPLVLIVIEEKEYPERKYEWDKKPFCEEYCGFLRKFIKEIQPADSAPCEECIKKEVVTGVLYCPECGRWYPIKEEIPILLPDDLRSMKEDIEFLRSIEEKLRNVAPDLADKILKEGKPFNLTSQS